MLRLKERAEASGIAPEEQLRLSVEVRLSEPREEFAGAAAHVLKRERETLSASGMTCRIAIIIRRMPFETLDGMELRGRAMHGTEIGSYEELEDFLRNWVSFGGDTGMYDIVGMARLFAACLENLRKQHIEADVDTLSDVLTADQIAFLRKLAENLPAADNDPGQK